MPDSYWSVVSAILILSILTFFKARLKQKKAKKPEQLNIVKGCSAILVALCLLALIWGIIIWFVDKQYQ